MSLRVFYSIDHAGHWPVGVGSFVLAENEAKATVLLSTALALRGLPQKPFTLREAPNDEPGAFVLADGGY